MVGHTKARIVATSAALRRVARQDGIVKQPAAEKYALDGQWVVFGNRGWGEALRHIERKRGGGWCGGGGGGGGGWYKSRGVR